MTEEKKPCPFCERSSAWVLGPTCTKATPYNASDRAFPVVRCRCGAEVPGDDWDKSGKTAIAAWNRRAPDARDARIAELEAELAALKAPAPIPPNSRELEPAICGCGDEYPAGGWDAGFIAALGHCANCAAALDPVTPEPSATPWYPDDSGEWVEVPEDLMEMPRDLGGEELISILTREMREDEYFDGQEDDRWGDLPPPKARLWEWDTPPNVSSRIVAYKVVKP